jgi:hypothetical protein
MSVTWLTRVLDIAAGCLTNVVAVNKGRCVTQLQRKDILCNRSEHGISVFPQDRNNMTKFMTHYWCWRAV